MPALSTLNPSENIKVLTIGESGSGKTCAASSFPGPVHILDFDNKVSSAAAFHAGTAQLEQISYENYAPVDDKGTSFEKCSRALAEMKKSGKFPRTLVLDSLTTFSDEVMRYLIRLNPKVARMTVQGVTVPSQQDYQIARMYFKQFLTELLNQPCNVIVTAHIQVEKDESTGEIHRSAMIAGKLSRELPIYFPEVYRLFVKDGKYLAQTKSDNRYQCRTQIRGLPAEVPFTHEELTKQR